MKKQYNGLDLLKFVMALFVIMIHVAPNQHSETLLTLFIPLMSIAVPVFFVISSVLIFSKLNGGGYSALWRYIKRLGILYFCWFVIDGWYIVVRKPYIHEGFPDGLLHIFKDMIFASTFPGSWYLSASIVGVVLVYVISRYTHPVFTFLLSFVLAYYVSRYSNFPESFQVPYHWYASHFREEVNLSFPGNMVWISIGQLLYMSKSWIESHKKSLMPLSTVVFLVGYVARCFTDIYIVSYLMVVSLFIISFLIELPDSPIYKRIRNYSILMFFFHMSISGKMNRFCAIVGDTLLTNWAYYIIVVLASIVFAETVLRLEKHPFFKFLQYIH